MKAESRTAQIHCDKSQDKEDFWGRMTSKAC